MCKNKKSPHVYSSNLAPLGRPWQEWITLWWRWCLDESKGGSVAEDATGELSTRNQSDPKVWFLAGTYGGTAERVCRIPALRSIFFPIVNDLISFAEYPSLTSDAELTAYAKADINTTEYCEVSLDGCKILWPEEYRMHSQIFEVSLPNASKGNPKQVLTRAVSDGYWAFFEPLTRGTHLLKFVGVKELFDPVQYGGYAGERGKFVSSVTYQIAVD